MRPTTLLLALSMLPLLFPIGLPAAAALELAPPTAAELALFEVPDHPGAPAVILAKKAELRLAADDGEASSFAVAVRIKILTEAGKSYGQVVVGHGDSLRLESFRGSTLLPGGERVPLAADAIFQERRGTRRLTKVAFPAVEVGAIVDYHYRLGWESRVFYEPWYLDDRIPTLYSEIAYHEPRGWRLAHRLRDGDERHRVEIEPTASGRWVRVVARDLPAVVEEPHGFSFADLARRVLIVPRARPEARGGGNGWRALCDGVETRFYAPSRRFDRRARDLAREMVRGPRDRRDRIETLYHWLAENLRIEPGGGILPTADATVDRVLEAGRGSQVDAALALHSLLAAAKIPARPVWAADWRDGTPDLDLPNPGWFDKVLIATEVEGRRLYLDPAARGLAAGRLTPLQEGTEALICDPSPAVVDLPRTPAAGSVRRARLDLVLDDDGRLHGRGALRLTGHHAWYHLRRRESPAAVREGWRRWLEEKLPSHEVAEVVVETETGAQRVDVAWSMAQRLEDVLGDEASLDPARPLGPIEQRYTTPPEHRLTPVRVSFADRDEVELRLVWPAGWMVELAPAAERRESVAGGFETSLELDEAARELIYRRSFEITDVVFSPGETYAALRELYAAMERHDAQSLVLVRE